MGIIKDFMKKLFSIPKEVFILEISKTEINQLLDILVVFLVIIGILSILQLSSKI